MEEATFPAAHYYALIACRATAGVREEEVKHARWTVWDSDDLSARVRALPQETARRLVRTNFGGQCCRAFLGLQPFTAFVSPNIFFAPLLDTQKIFNHSYALVGRAEELKMLEEFLANAEKLIFVLSGRGGIGKSKILQVFADRAQSSRAVYFVQPDVAITIDSFNELPSGDTILIIDDAHRRDDLGMLFSYAARTRTKLVLATRPQLRESIPSLAARHSVDVSEIVSPDPIEPLKREDVEAIAREVLGPDLSHLAGELAAATKDCPLITVVGGRLLREQRVPPALLADDEQFREAALAKFFDEIVEHAAPGSDDSNVRRLLEVVAALAPVNPPSQRFVSAVQAVSTLDPDAAIELCTRLERHGVLARRDDGLRIVPDLLSDYVLGVACERPKTNGGTFVEKVVGAVHAFDGALLRNLAAVDWRVGRKTGQELRVLGDVWDSVVTAFKAASHSERRQMLRNLKEVGYFLPKHMLDLAKFALAFPSSTAEVAGPFGWSMHTSHDDVIAELPDVVRFTAFNPSTFDVACDFLWQLANDDRLRAPQPALGEKSPLGILRGIMAYGLRKPSWVHERLIERLQVWLKVARTDPEWTGILSIGEVLFAKSAMDNTSEDEMSITIETFPINPQFARGPRDAAVALAVSAIEHPSRAVIGAGVKALAKAVEPPHSLGGLVISDEQIAAWRSERLVALDHLQRLAERNRDSVIGVQIEESVGWYAGDDVGGKEDEVRTAAKRVLAALRDELQDRIARSLRPWHSRRRFDDEDQAEVARLVNETAQAVVAALPPSEAIRLLNDFVEGLNSLQLHCTPGHFASAVASVDAAYTTEMCRELLAAGDVTLAAYANSVFWPLRGADHDRFHALIDDAIAQGNLNAARSLIGTYGWWIGDEQFMSEDLRAIRHLHGMSADVAVAGLSALPRLAKQHPRLAAELVLAVELGGDQQRAEGLAEAFFEPTHALLAALSTEELQTCVRKLIPVPQLDSPHISEMLKLFVARVPLTVLEMLADRIEIEDRDGELRYSAIPMQMPDIVLSNDIAESEQYRALLRRIDNDYQSGRAYEAPRLFTLVASDMNATAIAFLRECSGRRTDSALTFVASCVRGTGCRSLVLTDTTFTKQLLADAATVSHELFGAVEHALFSCAVPRTTTEELRREIRQQAEAARDTLAIGESARDFYQKIATEIQRIDDATKGAEDEHDPEED